MFTFFHRKTKITLDCFTMMKPAYEYTPIVRASKTFPQWWKDLPEVGPLTKQNDVWAFDSNMKKCYGFLELYKRGAVIENWCDLFVKVYPENYEYHVSTGEKPTAHKRIEFLGGFNDYHHLKHLSPWHIREKSGAHFMFMGTEWSNELPIKIMPGVVQYRHITGTHINMMLPKYKEPYEFTLKLGTPLVHIVPLIDDIKLEIKNHLVTEDEMKKIGLWGGISYDGVRGLERVWNRNQERKSKCPFGFG